MFRINAKTPTVLVLSLGSALGVETIRRDVGREVENNWGARLDILFLHIHVPMVED
jgi:hypothetical protein